MKMCKHQSVLCVSLCLYMWMCIMEESEREGERDSAFEPQMLLRLPYSHQFNCEAECMRRDQCKIYMQNN